MHKKQMFHHTASTSLKLLSYTIVTFFLVCCTSCVTRQEKSGEPKQFYDLEKFIEEQASLLKQEKPVVSKVMKISDKNETRSTSDVDWDKELELFRQADLNKSSYKQSYLTAKPDSLTYEYHLKEGENLPVQWLKIKLDRPGGNPVMVQALLRAENKLYTSEKNITLTASGPDGGKIHGYHIHGFQKLIFMASKPFDVTAKVQF